jgi:HlyD family secretion protein
MSRKKKLILIVLAVVLGGGVIAANALLKRDTGTTVTAEALRPRDLESFVSASGKIQPKRQVSISANQMGRVTRLAVEEGQRVKAGQFLLEIDPRSLEGQLQRGEATVTAARFSLDRARTNLEQAKNNLELARQNLTRQQELWKEGLTTRQELERAQNEVKQREGDLRASEQEILTSEQRIKQEEASLATTQYSLTQVIINSPMDGIVVRRNIEEGETAVVGTMNNAGSQLLTIADMSQLEAEVEVDETDIPTVSLGQLARVTIDAVPDRTFRGRVTEIGNSPIQGTNAAATGRQATNFKVVITLEEEVPDVRPGFTCTAEIITATRTSTLAVPIQALTVRERLFDASGAMVPERDEEEDGLEPTVDASELPPGHTRKETEGVFVVRDGRAVFAPVKVGIAGERYFELLSGAGAGERVITGPFASVRTLDDGDEVRVEATSGSSGENRSTNK